MEKVLTRLVGAMFVIFGALTLVFLIVHWLPGDPALIMAGDDAPHETIERLRRELGVDQPLWSQYVAYLKGLATGDLGTSFATGEPVLDRLLDQLPATLALTAAAALVAVALGVLSGVVSAVHCGDWIDETIQTATLFLTSMPMFWLAILLILLFSVQLQWLPAIGNDTAWHLVLPVATIGLHFSGRLSRIVRNNVLEAIQEPFVTTLRGKGLQERAVIYQHVLRSAIVPAIAMLSGLVGELLGGMVIIETVFARQGLGRIIQESVSAKDIPMVQGAVLFAAVVYVVINLLVDLSYRWLDRRIEV